MDNELSRQPDRRNHVRYQYRVEKRPMVELAGWTFPVLDTCERGLRFHTSPSDGFVQGATIDFTLRFSETEWLDLSGIIVRQQGSSAGIFLPTGIPQEMIRG